MKYEIRFDIEVDDDASYDEIVETLQSIVSFGSEEDIDDHTSYDFAGGLEVIPK